jgi:integrase
LPTPNTNTSTHRAADPSTPRPAAPPGLLDALLALAGVAALAAFAAFAALIGSPLAFKVYNRKGEHDGWGAKGRDRSGRQRWLGTYRTKKEADAAEARHKTKTLGTGRRRRRQREEKVEAYVTYWLDEHPRKTRGTRDQYKRDAERFAEMFGDEWLRDVDREVASDFAAAYGKGSKDSISAMMSDAIQDRYADYNPFFGMKMARSAGRSGIEVPDEREILELADFAGDYAAHRWGVKMRATLRGAVIVTAYVGVRNGELCGLYRTDRRPGGRIRIERQRNRYGEIADPKWDSKRTVCLPPIAEEAIEEIVPRHGSPFLLHTKTNKPFMPPSLQKYWWEIRAAWDRSAADADYARSDAVTDMDWYVLRHFCGSHMADIDLDEYAIAHQLGHKDPSVTRRIYIHANPNLAVNRALTAHRRHDTGDAFLREYHRNRRRLNVVA